MTSNPSLGAYRFTISSNELVRGRLNRPGTVRVDKVYTLDQTLTARIFGQVNQATLERTKQLLQELTTQTK